MAGKAAAMINARHPDATTTCDGWTATWYLTGCDDVIVTGATTPEGLAALPAAEVPLWEAHQYIPAALCAKIREEKYDHCPDMVAFVRRHQAARQSWHEYWERHPEMLPPVTATLPE